MSNDPNVLLVEDNAAWQDLLKMYIERALPRVNLRVVDQFQDADRELRGAAWDLLVADIGLPPDDAHVLGMDLVRSATASGVPCIVVSDAKSVTPQLAVDLVVNSEYLARGFFGKTELSRGPERRRMFQELVLRTVAGSPGRGPGGAPPPERPPARRKVVIAGGGPGSPHALLTTEGLQPLELPGGLTTEVFYFFLLNVLAAKPAEVVGYAALNPLLDSHSRDKAPEALRALFHDLNGRVREWLGLGEDQFCFVNVRGKGYCLNTHSLEWAVADGLRFAAPARRSVRATATDPHHVQENTPTAPSADD